MDHALYTPEFFRRRQADILRSALRIVPTINALTVPDSIVDVGCGCGEWLAVFQALGVGQCIGLDGPWVPREMRLCHNFLAIDLELNIPAVIDCDLAICLETAEHISQERSEELVRALTQSAPAVLWSAAPPGQGGIGHINEQPHGYWEELFYVQGYQGGQLTDWRDDSLVAPWYRKNLYLFRRR